MVLFTYAGSTSGRVQKLLINTGYLQGGKLGGWRSGKERFHCIYSFAFAILNHVTRSPNQ